MGDMNVKVAMGCIAGVSSENNFELGDENWQIGVAHCEKVTTKLQRMTHKTFQEKREMLPKVKVRLNIDH